MFPREVEELLITHPAIADAAAIGIDGQRLRAFAVRRRGRLVRAAQLQASVENNLARYKVTARSHIPRRAAAQPDRQDPQTRTGRHTS
jgi:acyl-CoA synthetase (AMP-forming)/AMP-acid ligase II